MTCSALRPSIADGFLSDFGLCRSSRSGRWRCSAARRFEEAAAAKIYSNTFLLLDDVSAPLVRKTMRCDRREPSSGTGRSLRHAILYAAVINVLIFGVVNR